MAITTTSRQTTAFTSGNNFAFSFKVFDTADVKVIQIDTTTKAETVLTLTSNYTVTLNDDQDANPGGTVTLVSSGNPQNLGSGLNIVITSKVEAKQQTELTNQGGFFPEVINDSLDKAVILLQQQQAVLDKTIKFPLTDSVSGLEVTANPDNRAKKVLSFDSSGNLDVQQEIGTFKGNWAASTGYVVRDIVKDTSTNNIFFCNTAHTSSGAQPLTTNANSANWDLIVDAATATTSSTNAASSASAAATSETNAANSATAAATSATNAASSASTATTKATQADTAKTAAETAKTAAETAQTAAETALDTFDDRYLGAKSSDPSVDNDGDALIDGALYFNTTDNVTKVYDSGNSVWRLLKITDANQAKINTVEASIANVNTVAGDITNVNAVAGNATNINNVAGNSSNINTVANNNTNVNTVAGNNANVSTVASDITSVNTVATEINNNNLQTVASNINAVKTAADDLNEATSEIDTVANAITNVDNVGNNISNVNTVAGISSNVTTVANNNSTITAVAANNSNITAVANNSSNINAVQGNETNINAVNANKTNIDAVAGNNSNITAVANNQSNINAVAADASDIGIVAADGTDIGLVAGSISSVNTTAGSIANVNTVASNISNVSSFAGTYQIASSDPSTDGAGNSLSEGDLYFNTSINELKVYDGSAWQSGVTNINNFLAKAGGQMTGNITFSGSQTVDGRDVSADGAKLDTIESNAKDDQTAAEIKTLLNSNGIVNSNVDASAAIAGTKISPDFGSQAITTTGNINGKDLVLADTSPSILFNDSNANDFKIAVDNGVLSFNDATGNANRLDIASSGTVTMGGNLNVGSGIDVTGDITVTGTIDGVDIAANNTLLGGLTNSNGVLLNGVTASTQGTSDNTTKVATTAFVTTAINNLINGAPGSLDTLNELAAAMADDAAFSTTVTNNLATKLNLSGGQITGNITCSGSQTIDGRDLSVDGTKLDGIAANAIDGSSLNASNLSSGTIPDARFPSTLPAISGANLTNLPIPSNDKITEGNTEVEVIDTGSNGHIKITTEGSERLRIDSNGRTMIGTTDPGQANADELTIAGGSTCGITIRGATNGHSLIYFSDATGANDTGQYSGYLVYDHSNDKLNIGTNQSARLSIDSTGNFLPWSDSTNNIGSNTVRFANGYFDTLYGDGSNLTNLPATDWTSVNNNLLPDVDSARDIGSSSKRFEKVYGEYFYGDGSNLTNLPSTGSTADSQGNTYFGTDTGSNFSGTSAQFNTFYGFEAGKSVTTSDRSTFIGYRAGNNNNMGYGVAVGMNAGQTAQDFAVSVGYGAGSGAGGGNQVSIGYEAATGSGSSAASIAIGSFALRNSAGEFNLAVGYEAVHTAGATKYNTIVGHKALKNASTLGENTAIGYLSMSNATVSGGRNTAVGFETGYQMSSGTENVLMGYKAGRAMNSGSYNVLLGGDAARQITSGNRNIAVGREALLQVTSTHDNIGIGKSAGSNLTSGANNIIVGTDAQATSASTSNEITMGSSSHSKFRIPGINLEADAGILNIKNNGSRSEMRLYCESNNAHYASIKAPAHSSFSGNLTYTLPSSYGSNSQVLTTDGSGGTSWTTPASSYTNSSVDTHLNTGSASSSQVLSWNGSDYAWVTQSGGGGGGGSVAGSNTQVQFNNNGSFGGSSNLTFDGTNLSVGGTVSATSSASGTAGMRKITASTSSPSGGSDGDVWIKYT